MLSAFQSRAGRGHGRPYAEEGGCKCRNTDLLMLPLRVPCHSAAGLRHQISSVSRLPFRVPRNSEMRFSDVGQLRSDTGREGGALRARSTSEILYAFRAKSRKFLPWRGRVAERLSRAFRAIPRATRRSGCGTDVSATSLFRVEIPRSFLKICVSTFAPPFPPRKAFRVRVPRCLLYTSPSPRD